jgi:2-polyprenyl-3-methyl-5-hydroxy-6-metoxy-1,4-benzoquinol methylase
MALFDLSNRHLQPELMDRPDLDAQAFVGALRGLRRVNHATGSLRILWPGILRAARSQKAPLRILDVACGGGDVTIGLAIRLRNKGIPAKVHGCDVNPLAVRHAEQEASRRNSRVSFSTLDAINEELPSGYDVIMTSLFLHHLQRQDAAAFLARAAAKADHVLVHDLVRSRASYLLAWVGVRGLLCNYVCRVDGPRSVEGAFTVDETHRLADEAGLHGHSLEARFPFRLLLEWSRV